MLRDEQPALMDHFLTNGKSRSIPKTIMLKKHTLEVIGSWGPRPAKAQAMVDQLKAADTPMEQLAEQLHRWYKQDKGNSTADEFIKAVHQALRANTPFEPSPMANMLPLKQFLIEHFSHAFKSFVAVAGYMGGDEHIRLACEPLQ